MLEALLGGAAVFVADRAIAFLKFFFFDRSDEARERNSLLRLFALEAVELQERWIQYVRQAVDQEKPISRSSPFEVTTADQLHELIKLGVSSNVVSSVYFVKEVTNDVRRQVQQAQAESSRLKGYTKGVLDQMPWYQIDAPHETFRSAAAFIRDRWPRTSKAVDDVITAAETGRGKLEELRTRSKACCDEYETLKKKL